MMYIYKKICSFIGANMENQSKKEILMLGCLVFVNTVFPELISAVSLGEQYFAMCIELRKKQNKINKLSLYPKIKKLF